MHCVKVPGLFFRKAIFYMRGGWVEVFWESNKSKLNTDLPVHNHYSGLLFLQKTNNNPMSLVHEFVYWLWLNVTCYFECKMWLKFPKNNLTGCPTKKSVILGYVFCYLIIDLRVRFFGKIRDQIIDPRSLGSRCIKGTEKSFPRADSWLPLTHGDPNDLGPIIRSQILQHP